MTPCIACEKARVNYNIARALVLSHSVYVSVLKIPIVPADSVSKSLRQKFFFFSRERPLLARGKILPTFATIMATNRALAHQSQNEDNCVTFSLGLDFLNEAEKEKNKGKGNSASAPSRFASLSEGEMQQILTERHSGKTKQMTNWSVSTFKGIKLKFSRFKIVKDIFTVVLANSKTHGKIVNKWDLLPEGINKFMRPGPWLVSRMESHPGPA